jgi:GNAT superfamily N-acetyltransferase
VNVVDLSPEHQDIFCKCLEDWSDEMKEAGDHKPKWCERKIDKGFRAKLSLDDSGTVGGMIQYIPIEESLAEGNDLYFILCIWVHGYKFGRGNFQKKGMGKALLRAAEEDARGRGAKGMVAWGLWLPFWMNARWFKRQGYKKVERDSIRVLLWKPFTDDAIPPKWVRPRKKPELVPGKVTVTSFMNGWCPGQNLVFERAKRASVEFGDDVVFRGIDTSERDVFLEWGISDALFINGKEVRTGPPPSYDKVKKLIAKQVSRLPASTK